MSNTAFDDLFGDGSGKEPSEQVERAALSPELPARSIDDPPPSPADLIRARSNEEGFETLLNECKNVLSKLPLQGTNDYVKIKETLDNGRIDFEESPTPFDLSKQLAMVQVMKDQILKIYADAHLNYTVRKQVYETLVDAYSVISQAKTADKRKGEASIALSKFAFESAEAEAFYDYCKKIVENLESQYKMISRRIFCIEIQLTLGELETAPQSQELVQKKKKFIREILDERKKIDSEPRTTDWSS